MLQQLIESYGYLALFIGTFLEGETIVIIAGIAAAEELLKLHWIILFAFLGTVAGDQLYFFIGRYKRDWILAKIPRWKPGIERVLGLVERHSIWLLLTFRFMYGVRNFTSFAVGMSRIRIWVFLLLNAIGAAIWAVCFALGGYLFGQALVSLVKDIKKYEKEVLALLCAVALAVWLYRLWRGRKAARQAPVSPPPPESE